MRLFIILIILIILPFPYLNAESSDPETVKYGYLRFRLGQGGFRDSRSEINKLGGGQLLIEIMPAKIPVYFSLSGEYWTNGPDPTHVYEIASMTLFNLFYAVPLLRGGNSNLFFGGGAGWLEVPEAEGSRSYETGLAFDLATGINAEIIWNIGAYMLFKYIHSKGYIEENSVIDFNELAFLIGLSLNFEL